MELVGEKGFLVNGEKFVLKGVWNDEDLGGLGGGVNEGGMGYEMGMVKEMGCNGIGRCDNMGGGELVKGCDEMGMLVMGESLDEWNEGKCKNGYDVYFDEWGEGELVNVMGD